MKNKVRLVCQINGHNKYYEMEQTLANEFVVSYGRIGAAPQTAFYGMYDWDKKYKEKIKKGYIDVSDKKEMSLEEIFANLDKLEAKYS